MVNISIYLIQNRHFTIDSPIFLESLLLSQIVDLFFTTVCCIPLFFEFFGCFRMRQRNVMRFISVAITIEHFRQPSNCCSFIRRRLPCWEARGIWSKLKIGQVEATIYNFKRLAISGNHKCLNHRWFLSFLKLNCNL